MYKRKYARSTHLIVLALMLSLISLMMVMMTDILQCLNHDEEHKINGQTSVIVKNTENVTNFNLAKKWWKSFNRRVNI